MAHQEIIETNTIVKRFRKMFENMASLLANDLLTRIATFILYALIARYLGAQDFGVVSLALTIIYTFQMLAPAGLRLLITREVTNNKSATDRYLVNGIVIAAVFSLASLVIIFILTTGLQYSTEITSAIFIVALGLIPFAISAIFEAIFQAWERMEFITIANAPRNILVILLAFLFLSQERGLNSLLWLLPITYLLMTVFEGWLILRYITHPWILPDLRFIRKTVNASWTFVGFQSVLAVSNLLIFIYLSKFADELSVGYYNAASQLSSILFLVFQSIVLGAFPVMCQRFLEGVDGFKELSNQVIEILFTISIPLIIGLFFLAQPLMLLVYGNTEFLPAAAVLQALSLTMILRIFSSVFGRDLLAAGREKKVFNIVFIDSLINAILGFVLIYFYGLMGAVFVAIVTAIIDFLLHHFQITRIYPQAIPWNRVWRATMAAGAMTVFLIIYDQQSIWLSILASGVIYIATWLLVSVRAEGGWKIFINKLKIVWSS